MFEKGAFWVRIYNLPLACMGQEVGRQIGASIGKVEMVDTDEEGAVWGEFLRARIKLDLTKPLLQGMRLKIQGKSIWVRFQYEQLPRFCFECGVIKHGKRGCLKRTTSRVKKRKPEYGPWLRVPTPTCRFKTDYNSWNGRSSPHHQDSRYVSGRRYSSGADLGGVESSTHGGKQPQAGVREGARTETPVNRVENVDRAATISVSKNHKDHNMIHEIRDGIGERESMDGFNDPGKTPAEGLTLNKGNILSNKQGEEGTNERTSLRKGGEAYFVGYNKYSMVDMEQVKGTAVASGRKSMEGCSDFGKPPAGDLTLHLRNERNANFMESNKNSHVGMEVIAPTPYNMVPHVLSELDEPGLFTPVYLSTDAQIEVRTGDGKAKLRKPVTKWKRRARGLPSSSTQLIDQERGNKKRGANSEDGNGLQGKRGRTANMEDVLALKDDSGGSGMAVAARQPRQPQ